METLSWDYVRADAMRLCIRLLSEGATSRQLRTILSTISVDMLVDEVGREKAAIVLRCIANSTERDEPDHRATEGDDRPSLTVIEGGGGSKVQNLRDP
jgi:hypothetical protein